jgi:hypothetical protein
VNHLPESKYFVAEIGCAQPGASAGGDQVTSAASKAGALRDGPRTEAVKHVEPAVGGRLAREIVFLFFEVLFHDHVDEDVHDLAELL